jgi:hypothetical protein
VLGAGTSTEHISFLLLLRLVHSPQGHRLLVVAQRHPGITSSSYTKRHKVMLLPPKPRYFATEGEILNPRAAFGGAEGIFRIIRNERADVLPLRKADPPGAILDLDPAALGRRAVFLRFDPA